MRRSVVGLAAVVVACVLCLTGVVVAQQGAEGVVLRYDWTAGDEITLDVTSETSGTVLTRDLTKDPAQEQEIDVWSSATVPMTLSVEEVDAEGNGTITLELGTMEVDMTAAGQQQYVVVDPQARTMTVNGEPVPIPEQALDMMVASFTYVMSPRGEIIDMTLPPAFEMSMGMSGTAFTRWLQMSQGWQLVFPEEPVRTGYSWANTGAMPPGEDEAGAMDTTMVYTMSGMEEMQGARCARIEMAGVMQFDELPQELTGAQAMPGGANLTSEIGPGHISIQGTIWFDPEAGQVVETDAQMMMDMRQRTHGTVEGPEGQQEIDMETIMKGLVIAVNAVAR